MSAKTVDVDLEIVAALSAIARWAGNDHIHGKVTAVIDSACEQLRALKDDEMPDDELRLEALKLAIGSQEPSPADQIVARAETYLRFLKGAPDAPAFDADGKQLRPLTHGDGASL